MGRGTGYSHANAPDAEARRRSEAPTLLGPPTVAWPWPPAPGHVPVLPPPPADSFPTYPASWYLFCRSRDLRGKPLSRNLPGRRLVAFRTGSGRLAVLDARCAHLGADLGRGRVVGEVIRCPFHQWEYGVDGCCARIPAQADIPAFARQAAFPVSERHGHVYVFNGRKVLFPLPFFEDCRPEELAAGRVMRFLGDCPWYMFSANAFDAQHWTAMHNRKVLGAPVIDAPHPYAHRIRFRALVTGDSIC